MTAGHWAGASVVRGPMAVDNYTQVHNAVIRGRIIHTRYVGVWAYVTSHRAGWRLTEQHIAADLGVGRDFVRSALRNFEAAHCLVRDRARCQGRLGDAVWFVTDLPLQLAAVGVTDSAIVAGRVQGAYEEWLRAAGAPPAQASQLPMLENPSQVVNPQVQPMLEKPTLAEPTLGFRTPKKTKNYKKTNTQGNHEGGPPPSTPAPAAEATGPNPPIPAEMVAPTQPECVGDHPHARARARAGRHAVEAVEADPEIPADDLAAVIVEHDRTLTHVAAFGRARTLLAWERPGRDSARPGSPPAGRRRRPGVTGPGDGHGTVWAISGVLDATSR